MQTINSLNLSVESQQDKIVIKNIYDLTYVSNPNIFLEPEEFRQIFSIELRDNNKCVNICIILISSPASLECFYKSSDL